ncbi:conserved hypothetical protein [Burkholderia gladioli]|uniref:hypothetical protein n=1 Tax=Burkholderia gladioli TaxID=28095 RepID=UPI00039C44EB|nr:hypothetical protein [Burkholderia gladioli]CAG9235131.1 conserved hypothetical protein [Burkholderia gladioli]
MSSNPDSGVAPPLRPAGAIDPTDAAEVPPPRDAAPAPPVPTRRHSLAADVHQTIGAIREQARNTARQLIVQAEDALLESLRALNRQPDRAPPSRDADPAPQPGEQA